jgi:glycine oxidase
VKVAVIGAGVAGMTCAVEFAERGVTVEVFERAAGFGAHSCSWYAGGMLSPWCECEHSAELISRLGEQSIAWWRQRAPGVAQHGSLVVAHGRDSAELMTLSRRTTRYEWLDANAIDELEPALSQRFSKGLFFGDEAHVDPREALRSLAERFTAGGGKIHFGVAPATDSTFGADLVVDCTGLAAREALQDLRGVRGEMLLLRSKELVFKRPIRLLHPRTSVYIVPRADGVFMVGATMIESDDTSRITARSVLELLSAAYALHPAFGAAEVLEMGAQVRPAFPDNLPRIVRGRDRLYLNGFFRHGFLLAPAYAQMAANVVLHGQHYPGVVHEDHDQR